MKERWIVGGVKGIDTVILVGPFTLAIEDGVVQLKALSLVIVKGPVEKIRCVGDVYDQVAEVDQHGEDEQCCAERFEYAGKEHCGWSGRAVAQANQDAPHDGGGETETDPDALQRAESAPLACADEVHSDCGDDYE